MNTTAREADGRRRRRSHSPEFRAAAIAACRRPGVSIASVALSRGLNANLLRRWVAASERDDPVGGAVVTTSGEGVSAASATPAFVALSLASVPTVAPADIRVEIRRGATMVTVIWPSGAAAECASWMRELLG